MLAVALPRAKWHVFWVAQGRVISKDFGSDLAGAIALYKKALLAGKNGATLCCKNMATAPPPDLQPHHVRKVKREGGRRVVVEGIVRPMRKKNNEGVWWCPYCVKLRRFIKVKGFYVEKIWVSEPGYQCPMCGVSHRDGGVRQWNPLAQRMMIDPLRRTRGGKSTTRRRRRR